MNSVKHDNLPKDIQYYIYEIRLKPVILKFARNPTNFLRDTVVIRPEFKFLANIEMTFSQILLAIK